jgi:hypothetical protein
MANTQRNSNRDGRLTGNWRCSSQAFLERGYNVVGTSRECDKVG